MEITISVSEEVGGVLTRKAAARGRDLKAFIEEIIETQAMRPSLEEILAPVRRDFAESGMTEDELDALIESERQAMWDERHGGRP